MEELLFNFGVHKDLIRNISFQKPFVDASLKPVLCEKLKDKGQGDYIFAFELFSGAHASFVMFPKAEICQVLNDRNEDVLGVVLLELIPTLLRFEILCHVGNFILGINI